MTQDARTRKGERKGYRSARVLLAISVAGLAVGAVAVSGLPSGVSLFTATPHTITVPVTLAQAGLALGSGSSTTIGIPITNLIPGQTQARAITLNNTGQIDFGAVTMGFSAGSGALAQQLQVAVGLCTSTPTTTSTGNVSCSSTQVVPPTPVSSLVSHSPIPLTSGSSSGVACDWNVCVPGKGSTVIVSVTLSSAAPSSVNGTATSLSFAFTGEGVA